MNEESDLSKGQPDTRSDLARMDVEFIRVLEDLINVLLSKGVINVMDLPPEALEKLNQRQRVRRGLRDALDLIPGDDELL